VALCVLAATACGGSSNGDNSVTVFAASSLTDAFTEIGQAFTQANPGAQVQFNFAASSELAGQIVEGAPVDVFASADIVTMDKVTGGDAELSEPLTFATNRLAIAVAPGNPLGIASLADLGRDDVSVVLCAEQVPCGRLASEALHAAGVDVTPRSFEENVKAVVTKVSLGEADAGIVYVTDVRAAAADLGSIAVPDESNVVAELPIAAIGDNTTASAFVAFVVGPEGQAILDDYGFGAPN
jgi:molybdate transport system substrate-binding protein